MGLYTNPSIYGYTSSDYTSVEPFKGEHFNYHELGIIAAAESAANRDAFMKAIALNELASVEQYGTEEVFYESVNIGSIFESIKNFFKKIIEKIHKIFHTFIAKLSSWFQSSSDFAKKYEKEIIKKWGLVKNDWEFKGYKFKNLLTESSSSSLKDASNAFKGGNGDTDVVNFLSAKDGATMVAAIKKLVKWEASPGGTATTGQAADVGSMNKKGSTTAANDKETTEAMENIKKLRENMDAFKDSVRGNIINTIKTNGGFIATLSASFDIDSRDHQMDSKDYTEELYKVFRSDQDSKEDVKLSDIGSAHDCITVIKEYDKTKTNLEKAERAFTSGIDKLISAVDTAQNDLIKEAKDDASKKRKNEQIIQCSAVFQSVWGFIKECELQAFSALLAATKDRCVQYKEVCVKVIGSSKKMTEESVDYSNYYGGSGNFNSFIENVKLV